MIFSELYSAYYNAVAAVLKAVLNGNTQEREMQKIVEEYAFSESALAILPSLKSEKWQLLKSDMTTPLRNQPTMPLTILQKRWLKAISLDPRIRLFDLSLSGLEDIEPLFTPEDYVVYDKYVDGDPYFDQSYVDRFKVILKAIREKQNLKIEMVNRKGKLICATVSPHRLEYSEKDDKFRLISSGGRHGGVINLARIVSCVKCEKGVYVESRENPEKKESVTLKIYNRRNALERCMLHFAHFEKQAECIADDLYMVHIKYNKADETEMVIRVLGFGPLIEVAEPASFRNLIIKRLKMQKSCEL